MHCVVSWDITTLPSFPTRDTIEAELTAVLAAYPWVRPLTTFYIVQVPSQIPYSFLINSLHQVANRYPNRIHMVITPLMGGGQYNGFLPQNFWPEIAKLST